MPPLHVLHLLESSSGGVARYVAAVAEGLTARGWRISVAGPAGVRKLASWCRDHDVSVIHGHQAKAGLLSGLVGRHASIPSIYTPHGWAFERPVSRGSRVAAALIERQLAHRYHARIVTLSAAGRLAAERWRVAPRGRIQVIPFGLPGAPAPSRAAARQELGIERDAFVAAWVGEEVDRRPLAAALRDSGVVLVALAREPATVHAAADVLLHTALSRAFPIEVLDAMAARMPVVAYDAAEVREQVQPGRTGYLVQPGDVEMMCDCVLALANQPATRLRMGHAGHRRAATRFSHAAMIEQLAAAYSAVAGRAFDTARVGQARPALIPSSGLQ